MRRADRRSHPLIGRPSKTRILGGVLAFAILWFPFVLPTAAHASPSAIVIARRLNDGPQLPGPGSDPSRAQDEARRILDGDDYKPRSEEKSVIERIRDWIKGLLPETGPSARGRTVPDWVSFVVVGVIAAAALTAITWGIINTRRARRVDKDDDDESEGEVEITPLLSVDEWLIEAGRLEATEQWREALRAHYRSLVGTLVDDDLLADIPGRTPSEHRIELTRARPDAAGSFGAATTMFEVAWFSDHPTGRAEVDRFRELSDQVRREAKP